ncbi:hypothetical protein FKM82_028042 [Ascaphus truei]
MLINSLTSRSCYHISRFRLLISTEGSTGKITLIQLQHMLKKSITLSQKLTKTTARF